jgi:tRNA A37 methylthiotransferase MiaB
MIKNKDVLITKEQTTKENRIWVRISSACNNKCIFCLDENAQDGTLVPEVKIKAKIKA